MSRFCPYCRAEISDDSNFCYNCGEPIIKQFTEPTTTDQGLYQQKTKELVTASSMIDNGIKFLKKNPRILWTLVFIAPISMFSSFLFTSQMPDFSSFLDYDPSFSSIPSIAFGPYFIQSLILSFIIDFFASIFFTSWVLSTYKQVKLEKKNKTLDLRVSFIDSFRYILKLIAARLIVALILLLVGIIFICGFLLLAFLIIPSGGANFGFMFLITLIFVIGAIIVLVYISVLYTYIAQAMVLGDNSVFSSLSSSARMARSRFWNTFGLIFAFGILSLLISGVAENPTLLVPFELLLSLLQVCSLAWGYQEFYHIL